MEHTVSSDCPDDASHAVSGNSAWHRNGQPSPAAWGCAVKSRREFWKIGLETTRQPFTLHRVKGSQARFDRGRRRTRSANRHVFDAAQAKPANCKGIS